MKRSSNGLMKELPTVLETTAGAVAGSVVAKQIEQKNLFGMAKYSGLVVAIAGIGASFLMQKNNTIKNVGLGMVASGLSNFADSMITERKYALDSANGVIKGARIQGLNKKINGTSMIGAIPKINDLGYSTINMDNVANI